MKDVGIVQGSGLQAVPLVIGKDTVYVHTDIAQITDVEGATDLWKYREVQYDKDEYIHLMANRMQAQASIAAFSVGAEVEITPETIELATAGATITEVSNGTEWRSGVRVTAGMEQTYKGINYECIQGHVTLSNWTPDITPALWKVKQTDPQPGEVLPWVAGEAIRTGDKRTYAGSTYECVQGHTTQAGWEPPNLPALWKKV